MVNTVQTSDLGFREVEWVAEQLGLDKNTVYRYLSDGRLPGLQLGKKWLVEEQSLRDFLRREQRQQTERRQTGAWAESGLGAPGAWDGTVTILFSDLMGSSGYIDQHGDDAWLARIHEHNRILREHLPETGRSEVKLIGDGFMVAFRSATDAVRFALEFRRALQDASAAEPEPLNARIGLHAGEVKHEDGEFVGKTVFIAALIGANAKAGEVLVSAVVRDLVEDAEIVFGEYREVDLKVGGRRRLCAAARGEAQP
jgi:excisionase family DNA binding protein